MIINKNLMSQERAINNSNNNVDPIAIYFRFPYYENKGLPLIKSYINKIRANCKEKVPIVFKMMYDSSIKVKFFCNTEDSTPLLCQSNTACEFVCPGCSTNYIVKTVRTFYERSVQHG